jgi:hypothetical protein
MNCVGLPPVAPVADVERYGVLVARQALASAARPRVIGQSVRPRSVVACNPGEVMAKKSKKISKVERELARLRAVADRSAKEAARAAKSAQKAAAQLAHAEAEAAERIAAKAVRRAKKLVGLDEPAAPVETAPANTASVEEAPVDTAPVEAAPAEQEAPSRRPAARRSRGAARRTPRPAAPPATQNGAGDLDAMTRAQLLVEARRRDVPGRSGMTKEQLLAALRQRAED